MPEVRHFTEFADFWERLFLVFIDLEQNRGGWVLKGGPD